MRRLRLNRHELGGLERVERFIAPPVAAVYALVAVPRHLWSDEDGLAQHATWRPIYIGTADDLRDCFDSHAQEPCWRRKTRVDEYLCVGFLPASPTGIGTLDAFARRAVARALISACWPSCNLGTPP